ncbi:hypothetical protein RhiirA5_438515 [Rhizophagus irregularis]|uniref:Uncharacterized protein n=1 Tax=Rhizophagus irregularis TaxID=588596 RepID=A0A2N0NIZ8_9GLOM|nr:hypothetical protein RhiirA5_438515 [Rhizophagus irregularis]
MEAGYAHSESAVLLCNTWDLVVSEGSGDTPPEELNPLIAFLILKVENLGNLSVLRPIFILTKIV